jgi:hypothetical protein
LPSGYQWKRSRLHLLFDPVEGGRGCPGFTIGIHVDLAGDGGGDQGGTVFAEAVDGFEMNGTQPRFGRNRVLFCGCRP